MTETFRLRFAPAPTGYLHLGSARAALFNWLYAQHLKSLGHDVEFVLRIEDTDHERSQPELIQLIFDVLTWLGITWDGEPVLQSTRTQRYLDAINGLLDRGVAYRCDCTQDAVRARAEARGEAGYDGFCRDRAVPSDSTHVVRFRAPDAGSTVFEDLIRGEVRFENSTIEDFVLRRSDGSPVFLVANALDDAEMGITHVIRGEDLINVTPKVLMLRAALGFDAPLRFAHMPLIVNEQRKKLSKRRDDVSVGDYIERGFLPEAMVNYLALLGWGPTDGIEVRPLSEIIELFDIADVGQSSAMFDVKKLEAINGDYIRAMSLDEFVELSLPYFERVDWFERFDRERFEAIASEIQPRVKVLSDVPDVVEFLFIDEVAVDEASWAAAFVTNTFGASTLRDAIEIFDAVDEPDWTTENLFAKSSEVMQRLVAAGGKKKLTQAPVRVAVTGRTVGPPLFDVMVVLGKAESMRRMRVGAQRAGLG